MDPVRPGRVTLSTGVCPKDIHPCLNSMDTPTYLPSNAAVVVCATAGIAGVDDAGSGAVGDVVGSGTAYPAAPDKIDKIRRIARERIAITSRRGNQFAEYHYCGP